MSSQELPHLFSTAPLYLRRMNLNEWIKAARTGKGMTMEALGEKLGRTKSNVSGWEKGLHEPSFSQVLRIAEVTETAPPIPSALIASGGVGAQPPSRPDAAEKLSDVLGDALQGLPAAMYARSVDACRRLAEAPDSNRARTEMWDVLQHSDALRAPPVPPKSPAPIDKAFREAFYALLDEGPDSKARAIVNELRDAIEQRVASQLGIDRGQAQRALAARQ